MHEDLRSAVAADLPRLKALLGDLVELQSVSAAGYDPAQMRRAAESIRHTLERAGLRNTQLMEGGGHPAVYGRIPAREGAPTILLYAHYDVQPPGPIEEWKTGPFEPSERQGRLYGRGASDDKAGIVMHLGAISAHGDALPVGVQVFLEGEEEAGSETLAEILEAHIDQFTPDVIVIGDGGNWEVGVPAFLTSLRGIVAVSFELRTLAAPVHSGQYGGVFPDALTTMARLLASLHDEAGNVAIAGLVSYDVEEPVAVPEEMIRAQTGVIDGVEQIGTGTIVSRLWSRPALSVLAIDAPPVSEAINQLVPVARAKVSLRIAPGEDAGRALQVLKDHLVANAPWGTHLEFIYEEQGAASLLDTDNFAVEAWTEAFREAYGTDPVKTGAGGSIPFIATFEQLFPGTPILVVGCGDPTSAIHAPNESQDLGDLEKSVLSEAIALRLLSERAR
jgi:cysteinylglycine-S-conjugate dipeptidase